MSLQIHHLDNFTDAWNGDAFKVATTEVDVAANRRWHGDTFKVASREVDGATNHRGEFKIERSDVIERALVAYFTSKGVKLDSNDA